MSVADRLIDLIPVRSFRVAPDRFGDSKSIDVSRKDLFRYAYVRLSNRTYYHCVVVDVDHLDAVERLGLVNLPCPNLIVENLDNGHAHYIWFLREPVRWGNKQLWNWLKLVQSVLTTALDGDPAFSLDNSGRTP